MLILSSSSKKAEPHKEKPEHLYALAYFFLLT
ncbi:hypothetical protein BSNT_08075 [Bacillus subtilis subsp. natto BEST195]|nr:hypothetical protein BSNT_08075 [Bacillus subtilis subsp. natto BEST195]